VFNGVICSTEPGALRPGRTPLVARGLSRGGRPLVSAPTADRGWSSARASAASGRPLAAFGIDARLCRPTADFHAPEPRPVGDRRRQDGTVETGRHVLQPPTRRLDGGRSSTATAPPTPVLHPCLLTPSRLRSLLSTVPPPARGRRRAIPPSHTCRASPSRWRPWPARGPSVIPSTTPGCQLRATRDWDARRPGVRRRKANGDRELLSDPESGGRDCPGRASECRQQLLDVRQWLIIFTHPEGGRFNPPPQCPPLASPRASCPSTKSSSSGRVTHDPRRQRHQSPASPSCPKGGHDDRRRRRPARWSPI